MLLSVKINPPPLVRLVCGTGRGHGYSIWVVFHKNGFIKISCTKPYPPVIPAFAASQVYIVRRLHRIQGVLIPGYIAFLGLWLLTGTYPRAKTVDNFGDYQYGAG